MRRCKASHSLQFISHFSLLWSLITKLLLFMKLFSSLKFLPWSLRTWIFLLFVEVCRFWFVFFLLIFFIFIKLFFSLFFRLRLSSRLPVLIVIIEIIMRILAGVCSMFIVSMATACLSWFWLSTVSLLSGAVRLWGTIHAMIIFIIVSFELCVRKNFIGFLYLCEFFFSIRIHIRMKSFDQLQIWVLQNFLVTFGINLQYFIIVFGKIYRIFGQWKRKNQIRLSWKHLSIKGITNLFRKYNFC